MPVSFGNIINLGGADVIQLEYKGDNYMKIGMSVPPKGGRVFHGMVLEEFLRDLGANYTLREDGEGPLPNGEEYSLIGAGICFWMLENGRNTKIIEGDFEGKVLEFRGRSGGYNIGINLPHLKGLVKEFPKGARIKYVHLGDLVELGVGEREI